MTRDTLNMKLKNPSYTLSELARYTGADLIGDPECCVSGINTLQGATSNQLSFLSNALYQKDLAASQAACVVLHPSSQDFFHGNKLVTEDPYYVFAQLTKLFVKAKSKLEEGVHSSVVCGENVIIHPNASIAPNTVLGSNVTIEEGVCIGAGCYIGDNCRIGMNTIIYANVSIYSDVNIGHDVIVHSQAVIGSDGFGFAPKKNSGGEWQKIYQLGGVYIGNNVEVGASTTIDRGALENTVINDGVKLDNQIQIAHNVVVGENTAIAGSTAVAGSTTIGKRCTIAGAVGIIGHLTIADDVHITAMTLVTKSIATAGSYSSGTPLNTTSVWRKNAARFNRLDESLRGILLKKKENHIHGGD